MRRYGHDAFVRAFDVCRVFESISRASRVIPAGIPRFLIRTRAR